MSSHKEDLEKKFRKRKISRKKDSIELSLVTGSSSPSFSPSLSLAEINANHD